MPQELIFSNDVCGAVDGAVDALECVEGVFVLVDGNTGRHALPLLDGCRAVSGARVITVAPGDDRKDLAALQTVWQELQEGGATRRSLLLNLGGGMVTDLGGLAAATFKRGMRFINVPTTLLGAVDASVGGKTGINFNELKNEIGVFAQPCAVLVSTVFFGTLPADELRSGFAEMLKHAMLAGEAEVNALLDLDIDRLDHNKLLALLRTSVEVKRAVVDSDPFENGQRMALNLGHTVGHAFESFALQRQRPVPHGYAVAWGLVVETVLSKMLKGFPSAPLYRLAAWVREVYGAPDITCDDYPAQIDLMRHDKKSRAGEINCTLLRRYGDVSINNEISEADMKVALDIYRDLAGI